jgi:hypothetical protein
MLIPYFRKFLDSDVTIPINTTQVVSSNEIDLSDAKFASISVYVKGNNAGVSLDVTFAFVAYDPARGSWDTEPYLTINVTPNGLNAVQKTVSITPHVSKIKLYSIQNQETLDGYTIDANASIFKKV